MRTPSGSFFSTGSIGLTFLAMLIVVPAPAYAAAEPKDLVKASLVADVEAIAPGSEFHVAVLMKIAPHWHTYWINPGETGTPTSIKLSGPKGFTFGKIQWPTPTKIVMDGAITYGYEDEVLLSLPVTVAKDTAISGDVSIDAEVEWLSCKETCIEGSAKLSIKLPVASGATAVKPANAELFGKWNGRLTLPGDHPSVVKALAKVEQPADAGGEPGKLLKVTWKQKPSKIEWWFPVAVTGVAIEDVELKHDGNVTTVSFKSQVFDAAAAPGGRVDGILVWVDESGKRVAAAAPVVVSLKKQ